jgi:exo-beta-1,3-glucanase (GH17 family)
MHALGLKFIRMYNVHYAETENVLKVIKQIKKEDPNFEMYLMLGAWIDCKNAWTDQPTIHHEESDRNMVEIEEAVRLTNLYPEIIKIIAVGNEAMVKWATAYYVEPKIILKWVNHLQSLKKSNNLPKDLWITSSDNFASWGGGDASYHVEDLKKLYQAVDYISMHTYPMHDTHYNPEFWGVLEREKKLTDKEQVNLAMNRSVDYSKKQYNSVLNYMKSIGVNKPVHIGETGWATISNEFYGSSGAKAIDEYKMAQYYHLMQEWTNKEKISCFYFEAFDEQWKDIANPDGSENHFGLINLKNEVKYVLWSAVTDGKLNKLNRNGLPLTKTFGGDEQKMWATVELPPRKEVLK